MIPIKLTRLNLTPIRVWDGTLRSVAFGMALAGSVSIQAQTASAKPAAPPVGTGAGFGMSAGAGTNASIGTGLNAAAGVRPGAGLVLGQVLEGKRSYEDAWQSGAWTRADLISMLQTPILMPDWNQSVTARNGLAQLLVQHGGTDDGPLQAAQMLALPRPVQHIVMQALRESPPPNTVELYEAMLQEKAKQPPTQETWIPALANLGFYYMNTGQPQKAAETWMRAKNYSTNPQWLADATSEAVRLYVQLGNEPKANQLAAQVQSYGYGWYTGSTLIDRARGLIARGKHKEARELLQQPVTGPRADQIRPLLLSQLSRSYYLTGEFEAAQQYAQAAISGYQALSIPKPAAGLKAVVGRSEERLRWIARWRTEPIICSPGHLDVRVNPDEMQTGIIVRRFFIRTPRPVSFNISSDNPLVSAHVTEGTVDQTNQSYFSQNYFSQQEVTVEIAPQAAKQGATTTLLISSPQLPKAVVRVPVRVRQ